MLLDQINLNHLRVFDAVYRLASMSAAARQLHLTQSGVSQHIKTLESRIGKPLFDRIQNRVVPTAEAKALFERSSEGLGMIEEGLRRIQGMESVLSGTVAVGMPAEFGHNVIMPKLAKFGKAHSEVKLKVELGIASSIQERLSAGILDFAFIDDFRVQRSIQSQKVFDEELVLCASTEYLRARGQPPKAASGKAAREYFEALEYVDYLEDESVLRSWFGHYLGARNLRLNVRTTVMEVQSVARLIQYGLGAGVLPRHRIERLLKAGVKLHLFEDSKKPLRNTISLACLADRTPSPAAAELMKYLVNSLRS